MSNTKEDLTPYPTVADQYSAIREEYMDCIHSCDQSYMLTLAGVAALYSWMMVKRDPVAFWFVVPLFIIVSFLKQHSTNRRAEKLRKLMDEMENRIINKEHALYDTRTKCRWETFGRIRSSWKEMRENGWMAYMWVWFWFGLLLGSVVLAVLRCWEAI